MSRWPVSAEARSNAMVLCSSILEGDHPTELKLQVIKTLLEADKLNLKEDELRIKQQPKVVIKADMTRDELVARARQMLGISADVDNPLPLIKSVIAKRLETLSKET